MGSGRLEEGGAEGGRMRACAGSCASAAESGWDGAASSGQPAAAVGALVVPHGVDPHPVHPPSAPPGRPEMVVGWYHSHPGFGCWLSGVDVNTQQSFEALNQRAVAVVVDPIQSVKGKVGGW